MNIIRRVTARGKPFFSVVMPTRDRSHLLRLSLQSVLDQTCRDFEVVVSDNSTRGETASWVATLTDSRLRYVRTPRPLPMPDSWEFALSHASGEYVIVLCDDDAWCPSLLKRARAVIDQTSADLINIPHARYRHATWYDSSERNTVYVPWFDGRIITREPTQGLRNLFAFREKDHTPKLLNSFVRASLLDNTRGRAGRLFVGSCPDYSIAGLVLSQFPKWVALNIPLLIGGVAKESIGAAIRYSAAGPAQQFLREFDVPVRLPLGLPVTVTAAIAETLLAIKQRIPAELQGWEIDWVSCLWGCWMDLLAHEAGSAMIRPTQTTLRRIVQSRFSRLARVLLPRLGVTDLAIRAASYLGPYRPRLHNLTAHWRRLRAARDMVFGPWRRHRGWHGGVFVRGDRAGFTNILECAAFVDRLFS